MSKLRPPGGDVVEGALEEDVGVMELEALEGLRIVPGGISGESIENVG
jgi:hypothetical protein